MKKFFIVFIVPTLRRGNAVLTLCVIFTKQRQLSGDSPANSVNSTDSALLATLERCGLHSHAGAWERCETQCIENFVSFVPSW